MSAEGGTGDWQFWTFVVAAITAFFLLLAALFAWAQVRAARRGRDAQVGMQVYQEFRNPDARKDLGMVYQITPEVLQDWEQRGQLDETKNALDRVEMLGVLVTHHVLDEALAVRLFGGSAIRLWYLLNSYIEKTRKDQGHYVRQVQEFAKRSMKYQIKHYPKSEWTRLNGVNLVEQLHKDTRLLSPCGRRIAYGKRWVWARFKEELRHMGECQPTNDGN